MEESAELVIKSYTPIVYTATICMFSLAMLLEAFAPRRSLSEGLPLRWVNNFSLSLFSWYITYVAGTVFVVWLAGWSRLNDVGLLNQLELGTLAGFFLLLSSSQFLSYWIHRAFHRFSWLWPLHAVHHSDTDFDVSTTFRHHPLEPLVSMPLTAPLVMMLGVSPESALLYRLFDAFFQIFSHSNIRVPEFLERFLRYVILTPDFHRTHHNADRQYTNSNYGSLVPWFDYLFGTARLQSYDTQTVSRLGLEYLREPSDSRLDRLILAPMRVPALQRLTESQQSADAPESTPTPLHPV